MSHEYSFQTLGGVFCAMVTLAFGSVVIGLFAAEKSEQAHMNLSSPAFNEGASIPPKDTCDGPNVSPPLKWLGAPAGTKSFALIADDPDAPVGTWVHWVLYDVPATITELPEGLPKSQHLPNGGRQGLNDFHQL